MISLCFLYLSKYLPFFFDCSSPRDGASISKSKTHIDIAIISVISNNIALSFKIWYSVLASFQFLETLFQICHLIIEDYYLFNVLCLFIMRHKVWFLWSFQKIMISHVPVWLMVENKVLMNGLLTILYISKTKFWILPNEKS